MIINIIHRGRVRMRHVDGDNPPKMDEVIAWVRAAALDLLVDNVSSEAELPGCQVDGLASGKTERGANK